MIGFQYLKYFGFLLFFLLLDTEISAQEYYNTNEFKNFSLEKKNLNKSNRDSVANFLNQWEIKAKESGDSVALAYIWMSGARLLQRLDNLEESLIYGLKAKKVIDSKSLSNEFALNKHYLAVAYGVIGNFKQAIDLALESVDEFELFFPYENRSNYYVLADAYLSINNFERMDHYLQEWYKLVKEKNVRMDLGFSLYTIYDLYDKAGMYDKASFFEHEYYKFYVDGEKDDSNIPEHAFITISGDTAEEKIEKLLKYLPYHEAHKNSSLISKSCRHLGQLYIEIGEPLKAIGYLEQASHNSEGISLESQINSLQSLADAYTQTEQFENALLTTNAYIDLLDSFKNTQVLAQANELEAKYENEKKELQLELKETQIQAKNRWLLVSAIAGLIAIGSALFILFLYRKLRSNNGVLSKTLVEKETLLKEIHHRVKNNLQVISSLLSLQSKYVKDENAISALNEGQNRVESMALIHQNLYREDNITGVNMKSYIPLLADNIFNSYNIQGENVKIEYEIDNLTLDVATVIPIGLVLNEIISNSLKYAFQGLDNGIMKVVFKEEADSLLLSVSDNGIGIKSNNKKSGFGTKLINSFTRKLDGELKIFTEKGTTVEILIKNYKRA